ncbi:MAG: hypothetical protein J6C52_07415 [Clostridia bacterium]|nr:hypothetical protein [Clostridia bacterium]
MKHHARALSLLLLTAMLAACGEAAPAADTTAADGTNDSGGGTASEPVSERDTADIPEDTDLGGFTFRISARLTTSADTSWGIIDAQEQTGDLINDIVYKRNTALEDKYNFTIEVLETTNTNAEKAVTEAVKSINAGDDFAEVVLGRLKRALPAALEGVWTDVNTLDAIDLTKSYWDQNIVNDLRVGGKNYLLGGNITVTDDDGFWTCNFNSALAKDYNISGLYDLAREGKWTLDVMNDNIKKVVTDLNADGIYDQNDRLGLLYVKNSSIHPWLAACKTYIVEQDGDEAYFADTGKLFDVYEQISELYHNQGYAYDWLEFGDSAAQISTIISMYENKQVLFHISSISQLRRFYRDIQTDFGVLPLPKYDAQQDGYATMVNVNSIDSLMIPITNTELEKTAIVLELMAANSWELDDTYFEVCLQSKYTRDEESYEMFKLGTETVIYDLGYFNDFGGILEAMRLGVVDGTPIASMYASHKSAMDEAMKKWNEYK